MAYPIDRRKPAGNIAVSGGLLALGTFVARAWSALRAMPSDALG